MIGTLSTTTSTITTKTLTTRRIMTLTTNHTVYRKRELNRQTHRDLNRMEKNKRREWSAYPKINANCAEEIARHIATIAETDQKWGLAHSRIAQHYDLFFGCQGAPGKAKKNQRKPCDTWIVKYIVVVRFSHNNLCRNLMFPAKYLMNCLWILHDSRAGVLNALSFGISLP